MKKYLLLVSSLVFPSFAFAQNCSGYYYLQNHTEVQMTTYDKHGKPAVVVTSRITDAKSIPGGMQSNFQSTIKDQDGNVIEEGNGTMKCDHGNLSIDMKQAMPSSSMKQFEDMRVKADEAYLTYPATMNIGQNLPGATFHMEMYKKANNKRFATVDYTISKRKVEGKETVSTPAGNWNCFKITYNMVMKIKIGIGIPMHFTVTEWFAPDFGIVKTTDYNKKGEVIGSTELTSLKKL